MKSKFFLWLILLLPLLLMTNRATPTAAAADVQITFETNPPLSQIRPHGGPTGRIEPDEAIIEVKDANGVLIPNVQIDLQMDAPQTNWLLSTDVPRIEGVTLLKYRFVSATGRQTFKYIFPIRGAYHVTIQAVSLTPGAFGPTTQTFDVNIAEKESSLINVATSLIALFAFGGASGFALMRSHRAAGATSAVTRMSASGSAVLLAVLALIAAGWVAFLAYAEVAQASETEARLQIAQFAETVSASNNGAKFELSVEAPQAITPSQPATLTGHLTDANGAPIRNVYYEVSIVQIEDDRTVFATSTDSADGAFSWTHDFWDGTEHTVKIAASPAAGSEAQFEPLTLEHVVDVTPLAPPLRVKVLGTLYLTAVIGLGMVAGAVFARRSKEMKI